MVLQVKRFTSFIPSWALHHDPNLCTPFLWSPSSLRLLIWKCEVWNGEDPKTTSPLIKRCVLKLPGIVWSRMQWKSTDTSRFKTHMSPWACLRIPVLPPTDQYWASYLQALRVSCLFWKLRATLWCTPLKGYWRVSRTLAGSLTKLNYVSLVLQPPPIPKTGTETQYDAETPGRPALGQLVAQSTTGTFLLSKLFLL